MIWIVPAPPDPSLVVVLECTVAFTVRLAIGIAWTRFRR